MVACFKSVMDGFMWGFAGVYGPNKDGIRSYGMNLLVWVVGAIYRGALGVISTSLYFVVKGLEMLD